MARITVEDCIDKFPSRFELVLVASNRARKLHAGEQPTIEKDNDKNTVIALREIATETIKSEELKSDLVEEYQTVSLNIEEDIEKIEEENVDEQSNDNEKIQDQSINSTNEDSEMISNIDTDSNNNEEVNIQNVASTEEENNL